MAQKNYQHEIKFGWVWMVILATVLLVYFLFDPMESRWMPGCVFHKLTGLQCMGCGTQRMTHALLHGEWQSAFEANAFVFLSLPAIIFLVVVELCRNRLPGLYRRVHSLWVIITISAMLLAWLILRNIYGI